MPPATPAYRWRWVLLAVVAFQAGLTHAAIEDYRAAELESWQLQPGMNGRQTWRQAGLVNYTYRLHVVCNCALNGTSGVYVTAGKVSRIEDMNGEVRLVPERFAARFTVPALFQLIDDEAGRQPDGMAWRLNRWLGYPEFIRVDPSRRIADDEIDYRLDRFRQLVPVGGQGEKSGPHGRVGTNRIK